MIIVDAIKVQAIAPTIMAAQTALLIPLLWVPKSTVSKKKKKKTETHKTITYLLQCQVKHCCEGSALPAFRNAL